jgi:hypothetical protein
MLELKGIRMKAIMRSTPGRRVLALSAFVLVLLAVGAVSAQVKIGDLKDPDDRVMGCSCTIQRATEAKDPDSQKFLFLSETGTTEAWMNINGRDTKLKLVKTTVNDSGEFGLGSRYYDEYTAAGFKIRLDHKVTWVCPPSDEECEHAKYDTTITVTNGKASQTLKAIMTCEC